MKTIHLLFDDRQCNGGIKFGYFLSRQRLNSFQKIFWVEQKSEIKGTLNLGCFLENSFVTNLIKGKGVSGDQIYNS